MGKVKISELPVASVVNPTDLIEIVQGGTNKQAVSSLIGGNENLEQVLANGHSTGNYTITSPDNNSQLTVEDGSISAISGVTNTGSLALYEYTGNKARAYLYGNNGTFDAVIGLDDRSESLPTATLVVQPSQNLIQHNTKNFLNSPLNEVSQDATTALGIVTKQQLTAAIPSLTGYEQTTHKDATGGYAGLTLFKINFKNVANTFTSFFTNSNIASRTYTFKDADGTVAFNDDVNTATSYTTPLDADKMGIWDTANSLFKAVTWANIKATLAGYFTSYQIITISSSATPTIAIGTFRETFVDITALGVNITAITITGTPTNGAKLTIRFKDNGTARGIVPGASFEACGTALISTTVISKRSTEGYIWDSTTSKFGCVAHSQEA